MGPESATCGAITCTQLYSDLGNVTPKHFSNMGCFLDGKISRNASSIIGDKVDINITIESGKEIPIDTAFFYVNKKLYHTVVPIMLGSYSMGYIYTGTNGNDTVFYYRGSGTIPTGTEIFVNFNGFIQP